MECGPFKIEQHRRTARFMPESKATLLASWSGKASSVPKLRRHTWVLDLHGLVLS